MKELLRMGDILILKSGMERKYTLDYKWIIDNFYDDDLNCITNDRFSVTQILRPEYEVIYRRVRKKVDLQ